MGSFIKRNMCVEYLKDINFSGALFLRGKFLCTFIFIYVKFATSHIAVANLVFLLSTLMAKKTRYCKIIKAVNYKAIY